MNGQAACLHGLSYEEQITLLDEKSTCDAESKAGWADVGSRFSNHTGWWSWQAQPSVHGLRSLVFRTAFFLLPSFVQTRLSHDPRCRSSTARLGQTAYLDGMRGLAALFVFFCHYSYTSFVIAPGWGYHDDNYHLLKLPLIRLFFTGPPMVCVFFVVSGYALSLKPLRLIHAHNSRNLDGFAAAVSSLTFRRAVRLFLPTAISTLLVVVLLRLGLYEWTRDFSHDRTYLHNYHELHYQRLGSTAAQLADWARNMWNFVHLWDWQQYGGSTGLDVHLWTIPLEFRCSMLLFLTLVGTARLRTRVRLVLVAGLMIFMYRHQRWDMLLFYAGMLVAETDVLRGAHGGGPGGPTLPVAASTPAPVPTSPSASSSSLPPPPLPTTTTTRRPRSAKLLWAAVSLVGLYLMSQPDEGGAETPGWVWLTGLIPAWWPAEEQHRYWQSAGAMLFVLAVGRSSSSGWWQRAVFNSPAAQYFGRISYAIYLMHGPVLHTAGYAIQRWAWGLTGVEGRAYVVGFVLASVFVVPLVVWVSDVFWRAVDVPVVRFAKWLEGRCCVSE